MMKWKEHNTAFIDSANLYQAMGGLGWRLDNAKFRRFLSEKYHVEKAYLFIGYLPQHQAMYASLQQKGYILIFKPTLRDKEGNTKGNCDADLVLRAMIEYSNYDKAVIVSGDGDFYSLVDYLKGKGKLKQVVVPDESRYSALLKRVNNEEAKYITFVSRMRSKLEYIQTSRK